MHGVLHHALAVQVEVEPHRPEIRIEGFTHPPVERLAGKFPFPGVRVTDLPDAEICLLLGRGHERVRPYQCVKAFPVLGHVPGDEPYVSGVSVLRPDLFLTEAQADAPLVAERVRVCTHPSAEIVRHAFGTPP